MNFEGLMPPKGFFHHFARNLPRLHSFLCSFCLFFIRFEHLSFIRLLKDAVPRIE